MRAYENDDTTHSKIYSNYILGIRVFALLIETYQVPEGRLATVRKLYSMESLGVVCVLKKLLHVLRILLAFRTFFACHFKRPSAQK